ncbi:MAG: UBP-type zinc finger domain-containing protein [Ginsengibacter sp.]
MAGEICSHLQGIKELKLPTENVCSECLEVGSDWVHLRTCQTCGATLCCDDSINKHMTKHYHKTGHPVIISAQPGERWMWCYKDELFVEY